ncbi:MAG: hypothetical protein JXR60_09710 [Bacteroidales bacterium]|nr:hypothetical protein [Bacteroidales bacterium]
MRNLILKISKLFDFIESVWESSSNNRFIGSIIVISYLVSLLTIHLNILGWLPNSISLIIPTNHFEALEVAFVLLLFFEVQSLVFVLPKSFGGSMIKQFEILSLILLRQAFKEFKYMEEPLQWPNISDNVYHMLSDAFGALFIFGGILIIKKLQKHRQFTDNAEQQNRFIAIKKVLSLVLIIVFAFLAFDSVLWFLGHKETTDFFSKFYTVLIFSDVFIVLVSLRYSFSYIVLFRNSGFAFATVLIRLALTTPTYVDSVLGVMSVIFAITLTYIYSNHKIEKANI